MDAPDQPVPIHWGNADPADAELSGDEAQALHAHLAEQQRTISDLRARKEQLERAQAQLNQLVSLKAMLQAGAGQAAAAAAAAEEEEEAPEAEGYSSEEPEGQVDAGRAELSDEQLREMAMQLVDNLAGGEGQDVPPDAESDGGRPPAEVLQMMAGMQDRVGRCPLSSAPPSPARVPPNRRPASNVLRGGVRSHPSAAPPPLPPPLPRPSDTPAASPLRLRARSPRCC